MQLGPYLAALNSLADTCGGVLDTQALSRGLSIPWRILDHATRREPVEMDHSQFLGGYLSPPRTPGPRRPPRAGLSIPWRILGDFS